MGTIDFKGDISVAVKKYSEQNQGQSPTELKLNYRDVMDWLTAEHSRDSFGTFIEREVRPYVQSCKLSKKSLDCLITLLDVDSDELTHFE